MSDLVKDLILATTQYESGSKGDLPDDAFSISASQLGKETLEIYLQMIYGPQPETEVNDATLGTIFHKGMETLAIEEAKKSTDKGLVSGIRTEVSRHTLMRDNWYLTGTNDIEFNIAGGVNIRDYKLTKVYTGKMYRQDPRGHVYGIQAEALSYLFHRESNLSPDNIISTIDFFYKDANKAKMEATHDPIDHDVPSYNIVKIMFEEKSIELQGHIENATIPEQCKDRWPRKISKTAPLIDSKCEWYCGQKHNCPYYKDSGRMGNTNVQLIAGW